MIVRIEVGPLFFVGGWSMVYTGKRELFKSVRDYWEWVAKEPTRHHGFLKACEAFIKLHNENPEMIRLRNEQAKRQVKALFVLLEKGSRLHVIICILMNISPISVSDQGTNFGSPIVRCIHFGPGTSFGLSNVWYRS